MLVEEFPELQGLNGAFLQRPESMLPMLLTASSCLGMWY